MPAGTGYGKGPVQSQTLYQIGDMTASPADGNFTTLRQTNTPASAGAITELASYDVPPGMTVRLAGGRKFVAIIHNAGAQQTTGTLIFAVEHADGSRTIFGKTPFVAFGAIGVQQDEQSRWGYTMTAYASGKRGDTIKVLVDDGGTAVQVANANTLIQMPVDYRLG
tara:strand:+ start:42 stop:539 length:498 start_codon:yes stop_codon:yes gene_type:complete